MTAIRVQVEHRSGSLPVQSDGGVLALEPQGVTYREKAGTSWSWGWSDLRLVVELPDDPGGRTGSAAMQLLAGLLASKKGRPMLRLQASDGAELTFELPQTEGDLTVIAQQLVAYLPSAAGRISVGEQLIGTGSPDAGSPDAGPKNADRPLE